MIGTIFTLINNDGDEIIINDHTTDPNNIIALQEYPTFELEIKNQEIQKEGQHGIWDFNSFYGKRLIVFSGVIVGEDEEQVVIIQDQLKLVIDLPLEPTSTNDGVITIKYTDPRGRALQTTGKIASPIKFNRSMKEDFKLNFQLVLKSANPDIESQTETALTGARGYLAGSMRLPTKLAEKIDIIEAQALVIDNMGNTYASPNITINGALTNPRIENITTGKYMEFTHTLAVGEKIIINVGAGTIVDETGADISSDLVAGSEFIKLKGGTNKLLLTSDENDGATNPIATRIAPTEVLETVHRDTYL
jgi:hypothetical protein